MGLAIFITEYNTNIYEYYTKISKLSIKNKKNIILVEIYCL